MTKRILVVDDEPQSLKLIGMLLKRRGYEVVSANSGTQALTKAQVESPDLIVLDIMMPGMDGYEVCRRLRADPATAGTPIIMFTARMKMDDKVTGFQAGADDYLVKPIHPEELASRVETLLKRSARRRAEERLSMRAKVFGFLGAKGGAGTTTLAVNVAVALARRPAGGRQVVLADMQSGMAASAVQLGLQRYGAMARLVGQPVEQIEARTVEAQLAEHSTGVRILSGQVEPPGVAASVPPAHAEAVVRHLGAMADYLLLDLGVGLDEVNRRVLPVCDRVVVAVEPDRVALTLAQALLNEMALSLNLAPERISLALINRARSAASLTSDEIRRLLQQDVAGVVTPAPELAFQAAEQASPMVILQPDSPVAQEFRTIAEYLASA
jgi:DNA-binding response OmpR family regulator